MQTITILDNASASSDGSHEPIADFGLYELSIEGTFNGGSYQLQATNANGSYVDVPGAVFYAAAALCVWLTQGTKLKLIETGTTSAMYAKLKGPINK